MKAKKIDRGLKRMLKQFDLSETSFINILKSIGDFGSIYDFKAKTSSDDGILWDVSCLGNDKYIQFLSRTEVIVNYGRFDYNGEVFCDDRYAKLCLPKEHHYVFRVFFGVLSEKATVHVGQYGVINYSSKQMDLANITYEDDKKKIIIQCSRTTDMFKYFMEGFLKIYKSDYISVIDIIKCLPLNDDLDYRAKVNIIDKVTGKDDKFEISDYEEVFLKNDGRMIRMHCCDDYLRDNYINFSCKYDETQVNLLLGKKHKVLSDRGWSVYHLADDNPVIYDVLDYLINLEFPISMNEVYNKFLVFSKEFKDFPFSTISIFNKGIELTVQMHNEECIMMRNETENYVIEWEKDGNFKYKKKKNGEVVSMVVIDKNSNAYYCGPVNCDLIDSKVIDLSGINSYKSVLEAQREFDEMKEWVKEPFSRLCIR